MSRAWRGRRSIAHGCNGKANDELRFELGIKALDPSMTVLAPARVWGMTRQQEIEYAKARRIPIPSTVDSPYTVDTNLWGRSIERGVLEDPWQESPEEIFALTRSPRACPDEPAYVEIEFETGVPLRANGVEMSLIELIESVETIAGAHGVGRIDMVENATTGGKSREIYEAPAAVVLHTAHRELSKLVIPRDLERLCTRSRARLRRPGPQRPLVLADPRSDRRVHGDDSAASDRRRAAQALQRRLPRRRPPFADGAGARRQPRSLRPVQPPSSEASFH